MGRAAPWLHGSRRQQRRVAGLLLVLALQGMGEAALALEIEAFSEPYREALVATAETGVLIRIDVVEGQRVAAGEAIAELDVGVLSSSLAIAEARAKASGAIRSARAVVKLRRGRLAALDALERQGHAREVELASARSELDIARAKLVMAEEARDAALLERDRIAGQIERRTIRSPFDGTVTRVHKEVGEILRPGEEAVATLADLERLLLELPVPSGDARRLRAGQPVEVRMAMVEAPVEAAVERIAPVTDADSGTVRVRVVMDNASGALRSGARCMVRFD